MSTAETMNPGQQIEEKYKLSLKVDLESAGPCKKHVRVTIPRQDIDHYQSQTLEKFTADAQVPGFRPGHVPTDLIKKRFKKELADQVRQQLLLESLEQLSLDKTLDPINEPDFNIDSLVIPDAGDFEYEFDVEVRPDFTLPDYRGLTIRRTVHEVTEADIDGYVAKFSLQHAERRTVDEPCRAGDSITATMTFLRNGEVLRRLESLRLAINPIVRLQDGEIGGFDTLMIGAKAGEQRTTSLVVSSEASNLELRGEKIDVQIEVIAVEQVIVPEINSEFAARIGFDTPEDLRDEVRRMLLRQQEFEQRQDTRRQVLTQITESADWDLPESLVSKQTENALRREVLEMQQAGFTMQHILARENQIRQNAISTTRQALKEHFVLDRIASQESIECEPKDIESEIQMMAVSRGENPRRVRARMQKSGMMDNLEAQIRERKAVDLVLKHAKFEDQPAVRKVEPEVTALGYSVCVASTPATDAGASEDTATEA